jgi:ABC-type sugar transport system substrate-binding protein
MGNLITGVRRRRAGWSALLCAGLVAVVFAGCGSSDTTETSAGDTGSAASTTGSSSTASADKKVKIAVFVGQPAIPTYVSGGWGAKTAGEEDGAADVTVNGPTDPSPNNTTQFALSMQQSLQPDGYAAIPCITTAWTKVFPVLMKEIPDGNVLTWNCPATTGPDETPPPGGTTFVGISNPEMITTATEAAIQASGLDSSATGTALIAFCYPGIATQEAAVNAAADVVKRELPNVKPETFLTAVDQTENTNKWSSQLAKTSDAVLAVGACSIDTASLDTLSAKKSTGDVVLVANDAEDAKSAQAIADGRFAAGATSNPWVQGYVATKLLIDGARGTAFPEGWINTTVSAINPDNAADYVKAFQDQAAAKDMFLPIAQKVIDDLPGHTAPLADSFE